MDPYFYEKEKREMAETQLHFIKYAAEEILEYISMGGRIEEWYQNKLSKVHSDMEGMHSWMEGEKRRTGMVSEETEQILEYGDTKKGQKMLDMVHSRATKNSISKKAEGDLNYAKKNLKTAYGAWKRMTDKQRYEEVDPSLNEQKVSSRTHVIYSGSAELKDKNASKDDAIKTYTKFHRVAVKKGPDAESRAKKTVEKHYGDDFVGHKAFAKSMNVKSHDFAESIEMDEGENKQVKGGDPCWKGYEMVGKKKKNGKEVPNCVPVKEQYDDAPFDPPYSNKPDTTKDKSGSTHGPMSRAKHLAKMAAKRQAERMKDKPTMKTTQDKPEMHRESLQESRRTEIVREAMKVAKDKKKKDSNKTADKFESEPEISTAINKTDV